MAKTDYKTIDEYHKAFQSDTQERLQEIHQTIKQQVPEAEETISYQIPCFKYKGYLIYYSAYAKHISLSSPWSSSFLNEFESELKSFTVTKSAIQFPNNVPLPLDLIKRMVAYRKQENDVKSKK